MDTSEGPEPQGEPDGRNTDADGSEVHAAGAAEGGAGEDGTSDVRRPIPVRPPAPVTEGRDPARATMPRPVRAGMDGGEAPPVPGGVVGEAEVLLELPDQTLAVRVRGRSRGHTSQGKADLLLLGFHREDEEEPVRETLVVGSSLEALTPLGLEAAWRKGRKPRDPFEPTELFPETSRSRGRGRGR